MEKNINVYNLREFIEEKFKEEGLTTYDNESIGIISNDNKDYLVFDSEGNWQFIKNQTGAIKISLVKKDIIYRDKSSSGYVLPKRIDFLVSVEEILECCTPKQSNLSVFIKPIDTKTEYNYFEILLAIKKYLKLDSKHYNESIDIVDCIRI